jgi:hypothetical protein
MARAWCPNNQIKPKCFLALHFTDTPFHFNRKFGGEEAFLAIFGVRVVFGVLYLDGATYSFFTSMMQGQMLILPWLHKKVSRPLQRRAQYEAN